MEEQSLEDRWRNNHMEFVSNRIQHLDNLDHLHSVV